jgi:hypothetical protein
MTDGGTKKCFVIMPISMPPHLAERYGERHDHFTRIYDALIAPAVERAGLAPVGPSRTGTENIQAAIINDLHDADLVLADLSALNPNVFLELGIRSALDKPVCLVYDGLDRLPFDSGTLNTHRYDPVPLYELNVEIARMAAHIESTVEKSDGRNELWKFFGSAAATVPTAELEPEDATLRAKIDRLTELVEHRVPAPSPRAEATTSAEDRVYALLHRLLTEAGDTGIHGATVRNYCIAVLGEAYSDFVGGYSLSERLRRLGLDIYTNNKGQFFLGDPEALA